MPQTRDALLFLNLSHPDRHIYNKIGSEPRQLVRALERDPEVDAIATGSIRYASLFGEEGSERSQVCRIPQRDAVTEVRHHNPLAIKRCTDRGTETVACQCCHHSAGRGPDDCNRVRITVRNPEVRPIKDRKQRRKADRYGLDYAAV